jgi:hypothetical protein
MEGIQPVYKVVKVSKPHCPNCEEQLAGNNSIALPYNCSCGVWKPNHLSQPIDYKIEKDLRFTKCTPT